MDQICRLFEVNILPLTILLISSTTIAHAQTNTANDYRLNPVGGCFIKAIQNRSYVDVPIAKFLNAKINALPHPRRPQYFAFKSGGVIHLTPKKCLITWTTPEDELEGLQDIEETEDFEKYERLNKAASENRVLNTIELGDMKYFVELGGGFNVLSDGKGGFDSSEQSDLAPLLINYNFPDVGTITSASSNGQSKGIVKSKTSSAIDLRFGFKSSRDSFWIFGLRRYSFEREDSYGYDTNLGELDIIFDVQESVTEFHVGKRYTFGQISSLRPIVDISLLLNSSNQKKESGEIKFDLSGSGIGLSFEGGFEFLLTRNLVLKTAIGYNALLLMNYRLKSKDDTTSDIGYRSKFDGSTFTGTLGLAYYFK